MKVKPRPQLPYPTKPRHWSRPYPTKPHPLTTPWARPNQLILLVYICKKIFGRSRIFNIDLFQIVRSAKEDFLVGI